MKRRDFLRTGSVSVASLITGAAANDQASPNVLCEDGCCPANAAKLPQRSYGDTGQKLSVIGFGGIVVRGAEQAHANRVVAEAIERGVNYFDVAPTYGDAEIKLGPALEPYRKDVFLACKTQKRTRDEAAAQLKESLARLRTDYLDLYQLHAIADVEKDVDRAFAKGGVMELFAQAKKQGQVRHLGFSAHSEEAALAAMDRFDFDSVLFPVNFATFYEGNFGRRVLEAAEAKGVARLALKAMARQRWPNDHPDRAKYRKCWYQPLSERREAKLGLYFTLSQPVTAAIPPGEESLFRLALELAMDFRPVSRREKERLRDSARDLEPIFRRQA
jgi:aryl-alcohol dehydrogenase-like predicted oxidoreductase